MVHANFIVKKRELAGKCFIEYSYIVTALHKKIKEKKRKGDSNEGCPWIVCLPKTVSMEKWNLRIC
jgi:hypothetical protein